MVVRGIMDLDCSTVFKLKLPGQQIAGRGFSNKIHVLVLKRYAL